MAQPQGLNGSIHAPRSDSNASRPSDSKMKNDISTNFLNPAMPSFTPAFIPVNKSTSVVPPSPADHAIPPHQTDRIEERKNSLVVKLPIQPLEPENFDLTSRCLRLQPAILVGTASTLPTFSIDATLLERTGQGEAFSIYVLAAGIRQGCSVQALNIYLSAFSREQVQNGIQGLVSGRHPVLFYAAERNEVDYVRLLLDHGCDAKACDINGVPALAYAIMRSRSTLLNPVDVVKMLLAFGADPRTVPSDMWENYLEAPSDFMAKGRILSSEAQWCTPYHRKILTASLNLSVRYFLHKASQMTIAKGRSMQVAQALNYTALLKVPYLIIGQDHATKQVVQTVATHLGMQRKVPLVLVFAGLSGHGKTELAKQLGGLLQIPTTVIDCAQMRSDIALFGSRLGYIGNAQGSQLNNHLADNSGQRSVVFLDEFNKTEREVHNSLLLVLDSGEYHDRRNNKLIDATKTIWVMATNLGDTEIMRFYRTRLEGVDPKEKAKVPYARLTEELKARFREVFGAPMAGRMRNIAPFFPFDQNERAVVAHKFLMDLVDEVREPIDTTAPRLWFPGHVHLYIKNDGKFSAHIAKESYSEQLGARSVIAAIDEVRNAFFASFTNTDELLENETNEEPLMKFTAQLLPVPGEEGDGEVVHKMSVAADGYAEYVRARGTEMDVDESMDEIDELFSKTVVDE